MDKESESQPNSLADNGTTPSESLQVDEEKTKPAAEQEPADEIQTPQVLDALVKSLRSEAEAEAERNRDKLLREYLQQVIKNHPVTSQYNVLFIFDEGTMLQGDADAIYAAISRFEDSRPILLILYSHGGQIGPAYLIGKLCHENAKEKFVTVVPRQAKSAATLLCCASHEIHMGSLSELGPIDPQIDGFPALGLKASVNHIADLIKTHPHAAKMFAEYLHLSLEPIHLGYYERVAESASQYAERLLKPHETLLTKKPSQIAKELVYSYKDHGFVIDKTEAIAIFGDTVVRTDTEEYRFGNAIYEALILISRFSEYLKHTFFFIGDIDSSFRFLRMPKN